MKRLTYLTGKLIRARELQPSAEGNPRHQFVLEMPDLTHQTCRTERNSAVAYKGLPPVGSEMEVVISARGGVVNYGWADAPLEGIGAELRSS